MADVISTIGEGFKQSFLMAYEVWWALVLGFAISAIVQAWVPRERVESALSGSGIGPLARATGLGAASSSCSYAAIAIAKSLFQKGASAATALAFQFASTNLVWELGLVLWVLLGWQFTLAEYVGGIIMIVLMAVLLRVFVSPRLEEQAREHAQEAAGGHQHHAAGESMGWRGRLTSVRGLVGRRPQLPRRLDDALEGDHHRLLARRLHRPARQRLLQRPLHHRRPAPRVQLIENVIVGPIIAVLSFVCSVGNVPLAAVLWSGGIGFAGVIAFIFADLIVLPIIAAYRKYYGLAVRAADHRADVRDDGDRGAAVDGLFALAGLIPRHAPDRGLTSSARSSSTTSWSSTSSAWRSSRRSSI